MRWEGPDGYWASDDAALTDIGRVHKWLSEESYWAAGRPYEVMAASGRELPGRGPLYR